MSEPRGDSPPPKEQFPSQYGADGVSSFDRVEKELRGSDVQLSIALPSGEALTMTVPQGQDVAWVKNQVAQKLEVGYAQVQLQLDGKLMFDPLSLVDFPAIKASGRADIVAIVS